MADSSKFFHAGQLKATATDPINMRAAKIVSISSGADDGANNLMAKAFTDPMRHITTEGLVSNINNRRIALQVDRTPGSIQTADLQLSQRRPVELFIGGHGNDGLLETGSGSHGTDSASRVYEYNYESIETLRKLQTRNTTMISIYSCYTGAGFAGASLLFTLSKMWNAPVRARTGLTTWLSRPRNNSLVEYENGSTWQLATPDMQTIPPSIERPSRGLKSLQFPGKFPEIEKLSHITVKILDKGSVIIKEVQDKRAIAELGTRLYASGIFNHEGEILGIVTSSLLLYKIGLPVPEQIDVYCDAMAKIKGENKGFFVGENFQELLLGLG